MRRTIALAGLVSLAACAGPDWTATRAQIETLDLLAETDRAIDVSYRDLPFDSGTVYVVAQEHGDLHTYSLTPCGAGGQVCGPSGRTGQVQRTLDFFIVTGAYRDRTFYLSPGGDGYLTWRGVKSDLAWN